MKFGKYLASQIEETLPAWRDKFLQYKELKKKLKHFGTRLEKRRKVEEREAGVTKEEDEFMEMLEREMDKFNAFFVEKEEEYIILFKDFQDRVVRAKDSSEEMIKIHKDIVDFHGEMVLLANYSALNYTGLVKILKKYDKRTGALLRSPFIQKVLQQPFFTTDLLCKLVKECEALLDHLFPVIESIISPEAANGDKPSTSSTIASNEDLSKSLKEVTEIEHMQSLHMKSTITALRGLQEIRSRSSTVSAFSLPPLQISGVDEVWKKVPVLEQVAK